MLSSIISPFLFTLISPKSGLIYHFNNNIILVGFIHLLLIFFLKVLNKIKINNFLIYSLVSIIIFINIIDNIISNNRYFALKKNNKEIIEFVQISKNIKKDFLKDNLDLNILTFDPNFMIWGITENIRYFKILNYVWVPKKFNQLEDDLFQAFKFLNLNNDDLNQFLENKFYGWRYFNKNIGEIFGYRYQSNILTVNFKKQIFTNEVKEFIMKSSPRLNQQIVIDEKEKMRLITKFNSSSLNEFYNPDIVIINNNKKFLKNYKIDDYNYCVKFKGKHYTLHYLKSNKKCN